MTLTVPDKMEALPDRRDASIVWFVNSLGYGESLLYWGEILPGYVESFPNCSFFTTVGGQKLIAGTNKCVQQVPSLLVPLGRRKDSYNRKQSIISPSSIRRIRDEQPDVVVISEFTMPSLYVAASRGWLKSRVLLLVESDPLRGNPRRVGAWNSQLRQFVSRRADLVLTNNLAGHQYLQNQLQVPTTKIMQRPYVVSTGAPARPMESSAISAVRQKFGGEDRIVFLYVGQLVERKGLHQILDAVSSLELRLRDRICVWLLGEGELRESLQRRIEAEQLGQSVRLVGSVPYETIGTYYQSADVFLMPTLDDYRALVGFEAIGFGLPVLHSIHDGAVGEVVSEGENGWRFDPRDCEAFADKIGWFVENSRELPAMGAVSRRIASQFDIDIAVDSLVTATTRCLTM